MWLLPVCILVTAGALSIPLSRYLAWIMDGQYHAPRLFRWFEERLDTGPQDWKQYTAALLILIPSSSSTGSSFWQCSPGRR